MSDNDLDRMQSEYRARDFDSESARSLWSSANPAVRHLIEQRTNRLHTLLQGRNVNFANARFLDVGCGNGGELARFAQAGARPGNLYGVEYLSWRAARARQAHANLGFAQANGALLPFADASFDVVSQFTAFTSMTDDKLKKAMAAEMWRVLRPGGCLVWYDMRPQIPIATKVARLAQVVQRNRKSPGELPAKALRKIAAKLRPQTGQTVSGSESSASTTVKPIDAAELRRLFPEADLVLKPTSLYVSILELAITAGESVVASLEKIPQLHTHYLGVAVKP